eukprot:s635_g24.t1
MVIILLLPQSSGRLPPSSVHADPLKGTGSGISCATRASPQWLSPGMSQKVTCRPLKGDTFTVEVSDEATVADLKKSICEKFPEMLAEQQKLIHQGKILVDETHVKDIGIKEGEFVVVMVAKAKPPPAPAPAPAAPAPTPAPASAPAAPAAVDAGAAAAATVVGGTAAESTVQQLMEMGFDRPQVERCLQAAFGNPDRAVEYLMSGIPAGVGMAAPEAEGGEPAPTTPGGEAPATAGGPAMTGAFPAMPPPGAGRGGGGGGGGNLAALEELRNHPRLPELAQAVAADPNVLPQIIMALQQSNPALVQTIRENPQEFMRLLQGGAAPPAGGDQDPVAAMLAAAQGGGGGGAPGAGQQVVRLTPEEGEAVRRLTELGFDRGMAVQAYLACDKNEELAANFLFENQMMED